MLLNYTTMLDTGEYLMLGSTMYCMWYVYMRRLRHASKNSQQPCVLFVCKLFDVLEFGVGLEICHVSCSVLGVIGRVPEVHSHVAESISRMAQAWYFVEQQ